mgnify:CR=1 FL=1
MFRVIIQSAALCFIIQILSYEFLWKYSVNYRYFSGIEKFRCDNRIVALIHSLIIPILVVNAVYIDGVNAKDSMDEYSYITKLCVSGSAGYFLWDMIVCFFDNNMPYTIHAVCCFLIYLIAAVNPEVTMYACMFLLYELSTPFGHIRWFLLKFFYPYNIENIELMFGCTFIFVRIIVGLPLQLILMYNLYYKFIENYNIFFLLLLLGNISLASLNTFWCKMIIKKFYLIE